MTLDQQIEGLLFYKATPVKKQAICKLFTVSAEEVEASLNVLKQRLSGGGTILITTDTEITLAVNPQLDEFIEQLRKDELKRDIGKAGAETLAIVLYRGPVTRADIDRIRGVNSSYIVRNLEVRGLIERSVGTKQLLFNISTELLRYLGIKDKTELTDYSSIMDALEKYEIQQNPITESI